MELSILWGLITIPGNVMASGMIILNLLMIAIGITAVSWFVWKVLSCMGKKLLGIQSLDKCFPTSCNCDEDTA